MIRNDIYTKYEGREYELIKDTSSGKKVIYKLRSLNEKDIERGFVLYERPKFVLLENGDKFDLPPRDKREKNIYLKNIDKNDVEYVYSIHTFGIYKGHKLPDFALILE